MLGNIGTVTLRSGYYLNGPFCRHPVETYCHSRSNSPATLSCPTEILKPRMVSQNKLHANA